MIFNKPRGFKLKNNSTITLKYIYKNLIYNVINIFIKEMHEE